MTLETFPHGATPSMASRAWPALAGCAAILLGIGLLAASAYLREQKAAALQGHHALKAELAQASERARHAPQPGQTAGPDLPLYQSHLADVEKLIRTSTDQAVRMGALQFRTDRVEKLPYIVRVAEFRVEEDYPRLKAYVAELLRRLPHAYLDEFRVDQAGGANGKVQATLRLSFVYQGPAPQAGDTSRAAGSP